MRTITPARETRQRGTKGVNPEWAKLPRRHCDDCGKIYKPFRPRKDGECGFCSKNCRKSYHKHGGAYRKLRAEVRKMAARELAKLQADLREFIWQVMEEAVVDINEYVESGRAAYQGTIRRPRTESIRVPLSNPSRQA